MLDLALEPPTRIGPRLTPPSTQGLLGFAKLAMMQLDGLGCRDSG
jgi:hypothetical protein